MPFDLSVDEFMQYAADKGMRRFGTISSARGRPLDEIDLDYSPVQLEDTFADEDANASLAAVWSRRRPAAPDYAALATAAALAAASRPRRSWRCRTRGCPRPASSRP